MMEAFIGVLFAACFVMIYLLVSTFRSRNLRGNTQWRELYPPSLDTGNSNRQNISLPTDEMSKHYFPARGNASPKSIGEKSKRSLPGQ